MLNGSMSLEQSAAQAERPGAQVVLPAAFVLAAFGALFLGYPLSGVNFSDFHFYERELPPLWGLSIEDPQTHRINYAFLYHNEGLMVLLYFLLNRLSWEIPDKLVLVNGFNIGLQLLDVVLFAGVMRRLAGPAQVFPY